MTHAPADYISTPPHVLNQILPHVVTAARATRPICGENKSKFCEHHDLENWCRNALGVDRSGVDWMVMP